MFLLELNQRRILIDPWFSRGAGAPLFAHAPSSPLMPEDIGRLDLILVTTSSHVTLDSKAVRRLRDKKAYVLVPDEEAAKVFRNAGYRRVRVVRPGDQWMVAGLQIDVSPAHTVNFGRNHVGFRVEAGGRSVWHTGRLSTLDSPATVRTFGRRFPSDILIAPFETVSGPVSRLYGMYGLSHAEVQFLARLTKARAVVPHQDDYGPSWWIQRFLEESNQMTPLLPAHTASYPRIIKPDRGRWHAFLGP